MTSTTTDTPVTTAPTVTTAATPSTPPLAADVAKRLEELAALERSLPDPDDAPNPKAGERAWQARRVVSARHSRLRADADTVAELEPKLESLRSWRDLLLAAKRHF